MYKFVCIIQVRKNYKLNKRFKCYSHKRSPCLCVSCTSKNDKVQNSKKLFGRNFSKSNKTFKAVSHKKYTCSCVM